MLARLRKHRSPLVRLILVGITTGWLGLALAPCVMATESMANCPHCPSGLQGDCADLQRSCTFIDRLDHDGRSHEVKLPPVSLLPVPSVPAISDSSLLHAPSTPCRSRPPRGDPDLNLRFCVLLN